VYGWHSLQWRILYAFDLRRQMIPSSCFEEQAGVVTMENPHEQHEGHRFITNAHFKNYVEMDHLLASNVK